MRMVEVEPLLFQEERGTTQMAFRMDDEGRPTHAFLSLTPMMAMERTPWHGAPSLHLPILAGGVVFFLVILPGTLVGWFRRRRAGGEWTRPQESGALVLGRWSLAAASAAFLGFLVMVAVLFARLDLWGFLTTPMTGFAWALALPVLGALAVAVAAVSVFWLWRSSEGSLWLRLRYSAAVTVALLFVWSLYYWNLLGWRMWNHAREWEERRVTVRAGPQSKASRSLRPVSLSQHETTEMPPGSAVGHQRLLR
jgi:hypothetical protein